MQSFLTPHKNAQIFFNTEQLRQFVLAPDSKKKDIPGSAYFKKTKYVNGRTCTGGIALLGIYKR